ncbi:hypothetical protein [Stutzerimonas nosocomialis]|uniref:hypothetical protein n=1 Tax=Stutzerimonas nosocomialis TaxID=1056496 RepID=UPI001F502C21|nr:hypothetical protein [Stutzerimonas nosocomialis]
MSSGMAICFKCGSEKSGALLACGACGTTPRLNSELALSLVLTDHLSSKTQLAHYSHELRNHLKLSVPADALAQAQEALKDPQLMAMLGAQPASDASAKPVPTTASSRPVAAPPAQLARNSPSPRARVRRTLKTTALHQTPFAILGVTTRDDRRRIVELAEEKSLELDHDVCQKARSDLTNPRTRLSAEIAWLPGVSPRKASQLVENLLHDPMAVREESGLPTLAHLNLLAAAFEAVDSEHDAEDLASFIQEVAYLVDEIDPEDVLRDINEDRAVSGFPEVRALDQIEAELAERKRYYRSAIKDALDRLPPTTLVQVMTDTVEEVTLGGEDHAPELIDDLVDSYEVETQGFLQKEAENVHKLIKAARDSANSGEAAVKPYVDKLDAVARNWDKVAQPIQLSAKARGIDHEASRDLAYEIRSLAIDLFNTHDMLTQAQRLTGLLQELFAELPEVSERVEQDADALADIFHERKQAVARRDEWAREITYRAEIGVMFKDTLSISPDGISWKGQSFSLDSITRVRWGGVRHSVNGVPTGTTYTIAFGDKRSEAVVELKKEDIYSKFIDKLWRAVCVRLLGEMLEALKDGRDLYFGDALLHDDGITLVRHKFLGANERVRCTWGQVQIWNADGSFCIGSKDDKKTNVGISYIHVANTHILEQLIRMAFKKPGLRRLSELLQ